MLQNRNLAASPSKPARKGEVIMHFIILAASAGAIAAAFSGLFGAPDEAQKIASVGAAIILPIGRWIFGQHH